MKALIKKINRILKDRRARRVLTRFVSAFAALVVFVTTYALVLPAITMETEANCGIEAHQHDDSCYTEKLVCGQEESGGHRHTDECYEVEPVLTCGQEEHRHGDACYDADGNLICDRPEHTHEDACFEEARRLVCEIPESEGHTHDASCYEKVLTCGKEAHTHSAACYKKSSAAGTSEQAAVAASTSSAGTAAGASASSSSTRAASGAEASTGSASGSTSNASNADGSDNGHDAQYGSEAAGTNGVAGTSEAAGNGATDGATEGTDTALTTIESAAAGVTADGQFVPQLEALDISTVLDPHTGIYYHPVAEGEVVEDSAALTFDQWHRIPNNTERGDDVELGAADLLRVYLSYTLPAGSLNATNPVARYRLPGNLHLPDAQIKAINENVNGIASQYLNMDTLEITETEKYYAYLGVEAVEGTRTPDQDPAEYLANLSKKAGKTGQEYISAVVRVENVYDTDGLYGEKGAFLGQDLVFTFTPYTIEKNQHEYSADGTPTSAGEEVSGWVAIDVKTEQVEWVSAGEVEEAGKNEKQTAEVIFVEKDKELGLKEISTKLTMVSASDENEAVETVNDEIAEAEDGVEAGGEDATVDNQQDSSENAISDDEGEKAEQANYPALSFDDSITVSAGSLSTDTSAVESLDDRTEITVHVEADKDTFPEGTTMVLSAVDDEQMVTVAEAVEGAVAAQKTMGFHALDISFRDVDGNEIEPLKPIKVSMSSDAIKKAVEDSSTAPVVVHISDPADPATDDAYTDARADSLADGDPETSANVSADSGDKNNTENDVEDVQDEPANDSAADYDSPMSPAVTVIETSAGTVEGDGRDAGGDVADTLTFEADSFSVYAIVYTVDFHWTVDGKEYTYSIKGGAAITLSELLPIVDIIQDDENTEADEVKAFLEDVESVSFSSPELVWIERADAETTVGEIEKVRELEVQYSAEVTEEQKEEYRAKVVSAGDWALISMRAFDSEETLTITMKNGPEYVIQVTDAKVDDASKLVTGEKYVLYVDYYHSNAHHYYTINNNGDTVPVSNNDLDKVDESCLWTYWNNNGQIVWYNGMKYLDVYTSKSTLVNTVYRCVTMSSYSGDGYKIKDLNTNDYIAWDSNRNKIVVASGNSVRVRVYHQGDIDASGTLESGKYFIIKENNGKYYALGSDGSSVKVNYDSATNTVSVSSSDSRDNLLWDVNRVYSSYQISGNDGQVVCVDGYDVTESGAAPNLSVEYTANGEYKIIRNNDSTLCFNSNTNQFTTEWYSPQYTQTVRGYELTGDNAASVKFVKFEVSSGSGNPPSVDTYRGKDVDNEELEDWLNTLLLDDPMIGEDGCSKTAEVFDYENRIYEIDITAKSAARAFTKNVDVAFSLDLSNSMLFPTTLTEIGQVEMKQSSIADMVREKQLSEDKVYFVISDVENTATVNALFYDEGAECWKYEDASKYARHQKGGDKQDYVVPDDATPKKIDDNDTGYYTLYEAPQGYVDYIKDGEGKSDYSVYNNPYNRLNDLKIAVKNAFNYLSVMASKYNVKVRVGWNGFAGYVKEPKSKSESYNFSAKNHPLSDLETTSYKTLLQAFTKVGDTDGDTTGGGTRPDRAFEDAGVNMNWGSNTDKYLILVTDGAPQGGGETKTSEELVNTAVSQMNSSLSGVKIISLGLSTEHVKQADNLFTQISYTPAGGDQMKYQAKDGEALKSALTDAVKSLLLNFTVLGDVKDTIDSSFYPVSTDGFPLEKDDWINLSGEKMIVKNNSIPHGVIGKDANGDWTVTWSNQDIIWPDSEHPDGWHGKVLVKSKEDFLGGNTIPTNEGKATVTPNGLKDPNANKEYKFTKLFSDKDTTLNTDSVELSTPYVNVDDLQFTHDSSSITVKLGASVNSMEALQKLYNEIDVSEVVTAAGTDNRMTGEKDPSREKEHTSDYKLSTIIPMTKENWIALLKSIPAEDGSRSIEIPYSAYGHDSGTIQVTLKQVLKGSEPGVFYIDDDTLPGEHITSETGYAVENYTLTVTYVPNAVQSGVAYHTTTGGEPGDPTDNIESVNTHIVNVMAEDQSTPLEKDANLDYKKQIDYLGDGGTDSNNASLGGTDAHTKHDAVQADINDLYRLYLDATMKKYVTGANIIIVEDYSTSMTTNGGYDGMRQSLVGSNKDGLIYDLLDGGQNGNQMMIIKFSDTRLHPVNGLNQPGSDVLVPWTSDADAAAGPVNQNFPTPDNPPGDSEEEQFSNGDNSYWTDYTKALKLIDENLPNNGKPTYVVFMSDGIPTVYMDGNTEKGGWQARRGYPYYAKEWYVNGKNRPENLNVVIPETEEFITAWMKTHQNLNIMSVGYGEAADGKKISNITIWDSLIGEKLAVGDYDTNYLLKKIGKDGYYSAENAQQLEEKMAEALALKPITAVEIRDQLSAYVELYEKDPDFTVTKTTKDGTVKQMFIDADNKVYYDNTKRDEIGQLVWDSTSKTVRLTFKRDLAYNDGDTYTLGFNVQASTKAYDEYASNRRSGDATGYNGQTGGEETDYDKNITSTGQPGFPSNTMATVTYNYGDKEKTHTYPNPVIQVGATGLKLTKEWKDESGKTIDPPKSSVDFNLYALIPKVDGTGSTKTMVGSYTITAAGENSHVWTKSIDNLAPKVLVKPGTAEAEYRAIEYVIEEVDAGEGYTASVSFSRTEAQDKTIYKNINNRYESNGKHIYEIAGQDTDEKPGLGTITNTYKPFELSVEKNWNVSDADTNSALSDSRVTVTVGRYKLVDKTGTITLKKTNVPAGADFRAQYTINGTNGKAYGPFTYDQIAGDSGLAVPVAVGTYTVIETILSEDDAVEWNHTPASHEITGITVTEESSGEAAFSCSPDVMTGSIKVTSTLNAGGSTVDFSGVRYTVYEADGVTQAKYANGDLVAAINYEEAKKGYTVSNLKIGTYIVKESAVPATPTEYILKDQLPKEADYIQAMVEQNKTAPADFAHTYEAKPKATIPVSIDIVSSSGTQYFVKSYGNFVPGSKIKVTVLSKNHADYSGEYWLNNNKTNKMHIGYGDPGTYTNEKKEIDLILTVPSNGSLEIHMQEPWGGNDNNLSIKSVDPYTEDGEQVLDISFVRKKASVRAKSTITAGTDTPTPDNYGSMPAPSDQTKKYTDDTEFTRTVELTQGNSWKDAISGLPLTDGQGNNYYYYIKGVTETGMPENTTVTVKLDNGSKFIIGSDINAGSSLEVTNVVPETVKTTIKVLKVIKGEEAPYTALSGAKFTLTRVDENGNLPVDDADKYSSGEQSVDTNGELTFPDLLPGRYKLEETKVPDGYIASEGPYFIVIASNGSSDVEDGHSYNLIHELNDEEYTIENEPGAKLPSTGGSGTLVFYLIGLILTGVPGTGLAMSRKRKAA